MKVDIDTALHNYFELFIYYLNIYEIKSIKFI